eukprot:1417611-Pyramimonas_sp.AAC.1
MGLDMDMRRPQTTGGRIKLSSGKVSNFNSYTANTLINVYIYCRTLLLVLLYAYAYTLIGYILYHLNISLRSAVPVGESKAPVVKRLRKGLSTAQVYQFLVKRKYSGGEIFSGGVAYEGIDNPFYPLRTHRVHEVQLVHLHGDGVGGGNRAKGDGDLVGKESRVGQILPRDALAQRHDRVVHHVHPRQRGGDDLAVCLHKAPGTRNRRYAFITPSSVSTHTLARETGGTLSLPRPPSQPTPWHEKQA